MNAFMRLSFQQYGTGVEAFNKAYRWYCKWKNMTDLWESYNRGRNFAKFLEAFPLVEEPPQCCWHRLLYDNMKEDYDDKQNWCMALPEHIEREIAAEARYRTVYEAMKR